MLEDAIPSFLASFHTWFTPTVLFVLLNVVIGTIAVTSKTSRREADPMPNPAAVIANDSIYAKLSRSPSTILHRIRSLNIHLARSFDTEHDPTLPLPPAISMDQDEADLASKHFAPSESNNLGRSQSDAPSAVVECDMKVQASMKKSASEMSILPQVDKEEISPHPDIAGNEDGWEVNARADDFINRFRQQLELQRRDSLIRYKATINGGA